MGMSANTDLGYQESIAAAVRAEFARLGENRTRLGEVIGKSRPTAAGRWHGTTPYKAEELDKVAQFLGITVYDLNDSAALGERFADSKPSRDEVARITPPQDVWAQPARSTRRAS